MHALHGLEKGVNKGSPLFFPFENIDVTDASRRVVFPYAGNGACIAANTLFQINEHAVARLVPWFSLDRRQCKAALGFEYLQGAKAEGAGNPQSSSQSKKIPSRERHVILLLRVDNLRIGNGSEYTSEIL